MIFESEITNVKLNENSIISAKEYLVKISKENKIDVVDLVLDEKYQNTLRLSLYKLYKGEGVSNISQQTIDDFRNYIDKVAKENNITVKQLFTSKFKLLL